MADAICVVLVHEQFEPVYDTLGRFAVPSDVTRVTQCPPCIRLAHTTHASSAAANLKFHRRSAK